MTLAGYPKPTEPENHPPEASDSEEPLKVLKHDRKKLQMAEQMEINSTDNNAPDSQQLLQDSFGWTE